MLTCKDLVVLLCLENVDNCDILISQLGSGEVFGPSQRIHVILQGSDEIQLEALSWDLQDCAFPLISDISTCTAFDNAGLHPDAVIVVLTDREKTPMESIPGHGKIKHSKDFHRLVQYSQKIAESLGGCSLNNSPVVILGDLAHITASIVSNQLPVSMKADQIIALDGSEGFPSRQLRHYQGQMSKMSRFCHTLSRWWNGQQSHPDHKIKLGTKFVNTKQQKVNGKPTGYFFSGPVDLSGPTSFCARLDLHSNSSFIAKVKAETDAAHEMLARINGASIEWDQKLCNQMAHL